MQMSDAAVRILSGLLEARTGQQLTISRRWRIETALQSLMRERNLPSLDHLTAALAHQRLQGGLDPPSPADRQLLAGARFQQA